MASWNDKNLGDKLDKCPVCLCKLSKKKMTAHTTDCYERNKAQMDSLGIIRCPLSNEHIMPLCFLNHHLEGNCQEVQNQLRPYCQGVETIKEFRGAPESFDPGYPEKFISKHNRDLLYILHNKLFSSFLSPEEPQQETERFLAIKAAPNTSN